MDHADLLIHNGKVLTLDGKDTEIDDGVVAVREDRILAVGSKSEVVPQTVGKRIDARGGIIMPGLVNTHTHAAMTLFRGLADTPGALDLKVVGGGAADLMEDVLAAAAKDAVLLTGLISEDVIRTAKVAGVSTIVFVRGKKPPREILDQAFACNLPILLTDDSLFVACGKLYMNGIRGLDGSW